MAFKRTKKAFVFTAVIGLLVFLYQIKVLGPAESFFIEILDPFFSGFYSAGSAIKSNYAERIDRRDLAGLVEELSEKVGRLTAENSALKIIQKENETLRAYLDFFDKQETRFVMANIISRGNINEPGNSIIIDKGRRDGVEENFIIADSRGIILGKVSEVKEAISKVLLITDKDCRLAAIIEDNPEASGIVFGEMGLSIKMDFIPQTEEIKEGDIVISSGLEKNIPPGLVIGEVARVENESNEIWQKAVIEPLVNFDKINIVSILFPR